MRDVVDCEVNRPVTSRFSCVVVTARGHDHSVEYPCEAPCCPDRRARPAMPRQARLDVPGTLHHVILRGMERGRIVADQQDRGTVVARLGAVATATGITISAWPLLTYPAHQEGDVASEFSLRSGGVDMTRGPTRCDRPRHREAHEFRSSVTAARTGGPDSPVPRGPDGVPQGSRGPWPSKVGGSCLSHQRLTSRLRDDHADAPIERSDARKLGKQRPPVYVRPAGESA
jgi:hypothetical protein